MSTASRPEGLEVNTKDAADAPTSGHAHRASLSPSLSGLAIPAVHPEALYIAPAAAANIVTSEVVTQFGIPMYDDDTASVNQGALVLINSFLDRLLFDFLYRSHSTSLASLRPAVTEVLRPKLAKEAIQSADDELREYMGSDEDELDAFHNGQDQPHRWDLELIWRRSRLRCMVYTRLGDMEEDDEEMYIAREHQHDDGDSQRLSRDLGIVSPAVAIFLTSILEFVGEHALMIAAHAAYRRHEVRAKLEGKSGAAMQNIVVEEMDMEKVAFNPIMGRLWRSWRKMLRSSRDGRASVRPFSPAGASRRSSLATNDYYDDGKVPSVAEVLTEPDPAHVPLPMNEDDVHEIEVPGYTKGRTTSRGRSTRPFSTYIPGEWADHQDRTALDSARLQRRRSHSLPLQSPTIEASTDAESNADYATPMEQADERRDYEGSAATPRPGPAPGLPGRGSVPPQHQTHAAQVLYQPRRHDDFDDEHDPAEGALQFSKNDYIINDNERAALESEPIYDAHPTSRQYPSHETSFLRDANDRYSLVSTYPGDVPRAHDEQERISPVERSERPAYTQSGEVSPISEDEENDAKRRLRPLGLQPPGQSVTPPMVSPLIDPPAPKEAAVAESPRTRQRREQGPSTADLSKEERREAFVVDETSQSQAVRPESTSSTLSGRDLQPDGTIRRTRGTAQDAYDMAPPLSPLREDTEIFGSQSQQPAPSSGRQQQQQQQQWEYDPYAPQDDEYDPYASRAGPQSAAYTPKHNQKTIERRQVTPVNSGAEKAAVQRISPVSTRDDYTSIPARSSESSTRPTSKPSSITKPRNNRTVSNSTDKYRDSVASRSSSDKTKSYTDERAGMGDRQKSFEQLISSGETIQYTLTPQNMRAIEGRESQPHPSSQGSPAKNPNARGERVQQPPSANGQRPRTLPTAAPAAAVNAPKAQAASNGPSFEIHSGPVVNRSAGPQPREARIEKDNTRDFADFIRSTGPPGATNESMPVKSRPQSKDYGATSTTSSRVAREPAKTRTAKGPRLEAREPKVKVGATSDLVDFIRQGPPPDMAIAANRVPAKFRSTFDSDQTNASFISTQESYNGRSVQSSTNSRTALIDNSLQKAVPPINKPQPPPMRGGPDPEGPVRKRRKPRDPYAIDTDSEDEVDVDDDDDDDDGDELPTPKPSRQPGRAAAGGRDESLLDFLNSAPPPSASMAPPPIQLSKDAIRAHQRKISGQNGGPPGGKLAKLGISTTGRVRSSSKGQAPIPPSKAENTPPTFSSTVRTQGLQAGSVGRAPAPRGAGARVQARAPREDDNSMRDLADFLRDSEPPPGMNDGPAGFAGGPAPKEEEKSSFGGFLRRKVKGFS